MNNMLTSGIYRIRNILNQKSYIGQAVRIKKRKSQHFADLKAGRHINLHLQSAWNKYGAENFIFEVILFCELHELTRYEQGLVDQLSNLYNIGTQCVSNRLGTKFTEEQRQKVVMARLGKHHSEETKRKIGDAHKGKKSVKKLSEGSRKKMSVSHKGKIGYWRGKYRSQETKTKIRETKIKQFKNKKIIGAESQPILLVVIPNVKVEDGRIVESVGSVGKPLAEEKSYDP